MITLGASGLPSTLSGSGPGAGNLKSALPLARAPVCLWQCRRLFAGAQHETDRADDLYHELQMNFRHQIAPPSIQTPDQPHKLDRTIII